MNWKRTVLVVDDSPLNRQLLTKILSDAYQVLTAENGRRALELLRENPDRISAVLLDVVMPELDGYGFLEAQKAAPELAGIPVLVMTQSDNEDTEIRVLALGAADFLTKPYKPAIIKQRLANTIQLRETAAYVNRFRYDELTGVYTREYFFQRVHEVLLSGPVQHYDLVCTDIERFKLVNEMFGKAEGDNVLKFLARILQDALPADGLLGRIGADCFVLLLPHRASYDDGFLDRLAADLNQYPITFRLNLYFGVYAVDDPYLPVITMCDRARLAVDAVKGRYDRRFSYYDDILRRRMLDEQMLAETMEVALSERQFLVYLQPKYELRTERIIGAEALVRWAHPQKGMISPGEFIPVFERNGFISKLDLYMLDNACRLMRAWIDRGNRAVPVSVNVSRADLYNPELAQVLLQVTKSHRLSPADIHLEITETAYMQDPRQLIGAVHQLKEAGFHIEMDDFGAGYSSLNMLAELPIDTLKLDMGFLKNGDSGVVILSFVIELARRLGLYVVAEGVETAEQAKMLLDMGCDSVQGYYFARPMPPAAFEALLSANQTEHP